MVGASYLFTGEFSLGAEPAQLHRRIRVIAIGKGGKPLNTGIFDCPTPHQNWKFRLTRRIPLSASRYAVIAETADGPDDWNELSKFDFRVSFWPRERWLWIFRGILRRARLWWRPLRLKWISLRKRYAPDFAEARDAAAWNRFLNLSATEPPAEVWRNRLTPLERESIWSTVHRRLDALGHFHHYPSREINYDTFPPDSPRPPALKLTVVTPSYQQGTFLAQTMDSVLEQPDCRIDYIVMDGGSTDESASVIRQRESRLKYWQSEPDGGQSDAIRNGFLRMDCEDDDIMAYLNSDDVLCPGTIPFVLNLFETRPELDVIYGHRIVIDEGGGEVGRWVLPPHDRDVIKLVDYIPQETLFWRRRLYDKVGGINPDFRFAMDWDLILRFQDAGAVIERVPWFLSCFRVHPEQKTHTCIVEVGRGEMDRLRIRENGGKPVIPEDIWDAVRQARVESFWHAEQLRTGNRI